MGKCRQAPGRLEGSLLSLVFFSRTIFLHASHGTLDLLGGSQFNYIGNEQMTWNKGKENSTKYKVLFPVVVTSDADENTVLSASEYQHHLQEHRNNNYLHEIFNDQAQVHYNCPSVSTCLHPMRRISTVPKTITMRFRNPTKLGVTSDSRLRQECCILL